MKTIKDYIQFFTGIFILVMSFNVTAEKRWEGWGKGNLDMDSYCKLMEKPFQVKADDFISKPGGYAPVNRCITSILNQVDDDRSYDVGLSYIVNGYTPNVIENIRLKLHFSNTNPELNPTTKTKKELHKPLYDSVNILFHKLNAEGARVYDLKKYPKIVSAIVDGASYKGKLNERTEISVYTNDSIFYYKVTVTIEPYTSCVSDKELLKICDGVTKSKYYIR